MSQNSGESMENATAHGCPDCERSFPTPVQAKYHWNDHHKQECAITLSEGTVIELRRLDNYDNHFQCPVCESGFSTKSAVFKHLSTTPRYSEPAKA
ncbi:hypothetical protein BX616_007401 [Lobosporangium transversale]|uniref:C2H2-type domain-containing protein n=1 Tax=Lobosporangium transversale TaxID=64571 RepID=A0A1Y2GWW4_9FUNG|nr:hypothetical protein BCR41DRAFT_394227 [Lobosporangium transversale]KAF9896465.1 hypothetical protein BX616_007401 [Lobosporangium transversale]ORZ23914.1 hypothetical protein BCR41DRAFT_394227 [Lobosporangium transversale]|eukprot:XP_021883728.1 hypothetical protein BCR41DRAFT_394227 [Lobosporangium transversale]